VGEHFPVMIKINSEDFIEGGLTINEMQQMSSTLEKAGIDAIELSGGISRTWTGNQNLTPIRTERKEAYFGEAAKQYKKRIKVPLMLVGGIRSYKMSQLLIKEEVADYISLCRPLIREPNLINKWKNGNIEKSECISDNACLRLAFREGLYCPHIKSK
jgi:2,4-dienoyl-CoA reductase-like NADH-dependent reductase (Old Yellow Enzyme family)